MCVGTDIQFELKLKIDYAYFVFFATLSSYSLHWYFTELSINKSIDEENQFRDNFNLKYKKIYVFILLTSSLIAIRILLLNHKWIAFIIPAIVATFIYSAPKIPIKFFKINKDKAIIKTIHLSVVWFYITNILPIILSGAKFNLEIILYLACNYIFIYLICLLFDFRDQGKEIINYLFINNLKYIQSIFFFLAIFVFLLITIMFFLNISLVLILSILIPFVFLYVTLTKSKETKSDYWYYFILDGLMCMPSIIAIITKNDFNFNKIYSFIFKLKMIFLN